jgi:atlastin
VAGEFRKGKSFILNFFLRYLTHYFGGNNSSMDWLDPDFPLASRFSVKRGSSTHTKGILLWSKPFLVRNPQTGEEIALLLMDTQGSYDDESSLQENAIIFSLSTMLSSTLVNSKGECPKMGKCSKIQMINKTYSYKYLNPVTQI